MPKLDTDAMEQHDKMRDEVMTEDKVKEADKYIEWFRSSWLDKDNRGLFDKWEMADLYWEGDVNLPESDDDPGSNTNIVNANTEGQVALMVEKNPAVINDPVEPSDAPFVKPVQMIMQFVVDKNKMRRKITMGARRIKKFGSCPVSVIFDPDMLDGMGLPWFDFWNPAYVFFDPNITDVNKIHEGRFAIAVANKSISWAKNTFDPALANAILPAYHPMEFDYLYGEDDGEDGQSDKDSYLHLYVWTVDRDKTVHLKQMSGCGVLLKENKTKLPKGRYPWFVIPDMDREGTVWGKASNELLYNTQDIINDLDDQIRINARLMGNIQKVIDTGSGIDPDKWTNEPGLNIMANNAATAFQIVQPKEMPQYIQERRSMALNVERPLVSRFSDQMAGIQQRGVDTATEALALQQSGLAGIELTKTVMQEVLGEALEYAFELVVENWTQEMAFKITDDPNTFAWFKPSNLKNIPRLIPASQDYIAQFEKANPGVEVPKYMQGDDGGKPATKKAQFDMRLSLGAGMPTNKAFKYTAVKEGFVNGAIAIPEYRKLLREFIDLPIVDEVQEQQTVDALGMQAVAKSGGAPMGAEMPYADIQGLSSKGNPAALNQLGGGLNSGFDTKKPA